MKIKGAIFDMDGTLVDSLMFWDFFWSEFGSKYLEKENFRPSAELDKSVRTMILAETVPYIKKLYSLSDRGDDLDEFMKDMLKHFYLNVALVKKGAFEFLGYLKEKNIKMAVASATDYKYVKLALDNFGLTKYFDTVLSCADISVGKDKPDIYILAKNTLGIDDPSDICVFEDSFLAAETAKKAGFKTVGLYDKYNFDQKRLAAASDIYIDADQSLLDLIGEIN